MSVREAIQANAQRYVGWLTEACSIVSLPDEPDGLQEMVAWLEGRFAELGAATERLVYKDAPDALFAHLGSGSRTILVYDHYDVQPVEPIDLWESGPFTPVVSRGVFFARGAADNKGDLVARLAALDVYRQEIGDLPITVKFLVEGEEETGSPNFQAIVSRYGHKLGADGCIWEGTGLDHSGRPGMVCGTKGLAYVELMHRGLRGDQHSLYAVIAPSPVWHLIGALGTLLGPGGRVSIDGFYDDVVPPTPTDLELLRALPFDEEAEKQRLGLDGFVADASGLELKRRYFFEPTCNIAGMAAGFTTPGASKTILPEKALARVDMRLVPNQDPLDIVAKLRRHLEQHGYADIQVCTHSMHQPVRSPTDSSISKAALRAAEKTFAAPPTLAPFMIGTGPMHSIAHLLGIPTVSPAGVCRPDSRMHAPNENCRIEDFLRMIEYTVAWIDEFSAT